MILSCLLEQHEFSQPTLTLAKLLLLLLLLLMLMLLMLLVELNR